MIHRPSIHHVMMVAHGGVDGGAKLYLLGCCLCCHDDAFGSCTFVEEFGSRDWFKGLGE